MQALMTVADAVREFPTLNRADRHNRCSDTYRPISTRETLEGLEAAGFGIASVQYARTRDESRRGFQKHLIRLRHPSHRFGEEFGEILAINSFDLSSSWSLTAGLFRFVCSNGLVVGTAWAKQTVAHRGDNVTERVVNATQRIAGTFDRINERVDRLKRVELSANDQTRFAYRAAQLRWADPNKMPFDFRLLLNARRPGDEGDNLWHVFNRVQENIVRGGIGGQVVGSNGRMRRATSRGIAAIGANIAINSKLSNLADEFAGLEVA